MSGPNVENFFTFGFGQAYPGGYVEIAGESPGACREVMFEIFGKRWSMQYWSAVAAGVEEYGLSEVHACLICRLPVTFPWGDDPQGLIAFWTDHPSGLCACAGRRSRFG